MRSLLLTLLFLPSVVLCSTVKTPFGDIEGFEHITESGISTNVFLGIRYGQAPAGNGRFKKPEMVEKWAPALHTAKKYGAACIQFTEKFLVYGDNYSEDCLFMNIITPTHKQSSDLPVFFFIHGGGFGYGASNDLGYKRIAEYVVSKGIVVVTINYRVGPYGFFSLGVSDAPGNMGLWDQTLALKFLHEIIPSFGGDVSRITVGGESGGGCSTSALQFSPHSNTLFSQGVMMSGSVLAEFSQSDAVVEESKKLAEELGCKEKTTTLTLSCLQTRTTREIFQAVDKMDIVRRHPNFIMFHPRFDGEFFPQPIHELAKTAPKKRTLSGSADQDGAFLVFYQLFVSGLVVPESKWNTYSRDDLIEFIETAVVTDKEHYDSASDFRRKLVEFYVEKDEKKGDSAFYLQRYSDLVSDLDFLIPLYYEVQMKLANNWPTFLYILQHSPKDRDAYPVRGAWHADEISYFTDFALTLNVNDPEFKSFGRHFSSALVNFIKNGDPSSSTFTWLPISKEHPFRHASISSNISLKDKPYRPDAAQLWLEIVPKSVPVEALRTSRLPGADKSHFVHYEL